MTRYRKRPIVVDAVVWSGDNEAEASEFCLDHAGDTPFARFLVDGLRDADVYVAKSGAYCHVERGGAVIAEPDGNGVYPCTREQFEATYEPVPETGETDG